MSDTPCTICIKDINYISLLINTKRDIRLLNKKHILRNVFCYINLKYNDTITIFASLLYDYFCGNYSFD